jgi:hypothetical protein
VKPPVKIFELSDNAAVSIKIMFVQKDNNLFTKKNFPPPVANTTLVNVSESNVKKSSQNTTHTDFARPVTNQKPKLSTNVVPNKLVFATLNNVDCYNSKVNTKNANLVALKLLTPTNVVVNTKPALALSVNTKTVFNTQSDQSQSPINADHATVTPTELSLVLTSENNQNALKNQFVINSTNEKNSSIKLNAVPLTNASTMNAQPMLNAKTFSENHLFQLVKPVNPHEPLVNSYTLSLTKLKLLIAVWSMNVFATLVQPLLLHCVTAKVVN